MRASSPLQLASAMSSWQTTNELVSPDGANLRGKIGFIFAGISLLGISWGKYLSTNTLRKHCYLLGHR